MTGMPDLNYPAFHAFAERWRKAGWTILNPAEHFEGRTDLERPLFMAADIEDLLSADGIAQLSGWETSRGARLEAAVAIELDLPFFNAETMAPIPMPNVAVVANVGTLEGKIAARTAPQDLKAMTDKWVAFGTPDSISQEAHSLVYGDRNKAYGHPYDDYKRTSGLWEALLGLEPGAIGPYRAALMMALMKASRAAYQYKRDSLVDLAGYAECAHRIHRREAGEE